MRSHKERSRPTLKQIKRPAVVEHLDAPIERRKTTFSEAFARAIVDALDKRGDERKVNILEDTLRAAAWGLHEKKLNRKVILNAIDSVIYRRIFEGEPDTATTVIIFSKHYLNMDSELCTKAYSDGLAALIEAGDIEQAIKTKKHGERYTEATGGNKKLMEGVVIGVQNRIERGDFETAGSAAYELGLGEQELLELVEKANKKIKAGALLLGLRP